MKYKMVDERFFFFFFFERGRWDMRACWARWWVNLDQITIHRWLKFNLRKSNPCLFIWPRLILFILLHLTLYTLTYMCVWTYKLYVCLWLYVYAYVCTHMYDVWIDRYSHSTCYWRTWYAVAFGISKKQTGITTRQNFCRGTAL